jgi:hypothetical protein
VKGGLVEGGRRREEGERGRGESESDGRRREFVLSAGVKSEEKRIDASKGVSLFNLGARSFTDGTAHVRVPPRI